MSRWRQQWAWVARTTVCGFLRESRLGGMLVLAMLASAAGWWWRDFNFGSEEGRFLLNFGLSVQAVGSVVIAVAGVLAVVWREREDGLGQMMQAHGLSGTAVVFGQWVGIWLVSFVFVIGSAGVIAAMLRIAGHEVPTAQLIWAAVLHGAKGGVVIAFTLWFAGYARSMVFVVLAAGLMTALGHLKSLANEIDGLGWWLSRPVPDLSLLGGGRWMEQGMPMLTGVSHLTYALGYLLIFGWLAARSYSRREY